VSYLPLKGHCPECGIETKRGGYCQSCVDVAIRKVDRMMLNEARYVQIKQYIEVNDAMLNGFEIQQYYAWIQGLNASERKTFQSELLDALARVLCDIESNAISEVIRRYYESHKEEQSCLMPSTGS
jgi:methionyl-tRNA synthetase